ncbi:hypothetical protein AALP_AA5G052300 [Arabis alpina]|nr:hypothetical protein AALP_AA5G052300 [Arabis alpina]
MLSLYVEIDNSTLVNNPQKTVLAEVKFFIYNQKEDVYLTYQETDAKSFSLFKPFWGQPRTKSYGDIVNLGYGYLFDGQLAIGVDVFVTNTFMQWEAFRFTYDFHHRLYTWPISKFSTLDKEFYVSDKFEIGGRSWTLKLYPSGDGDGEGNSVSLYLVPADVIPYERIYLRAKLRIIDQKDSKHFERQVEFWANRTNSWGFQKFVSFSDLKNTSTGLLVNDVLKVQVAFEDLSKTKYYPE